MTESTTPQLSEAEVEEIEARHARADSIVEDFYTSEFAVSASLNGTPALIRDWRALRAALSKANEIVEEAVHANAALREQLAQVTKERDDARRKLTRRCAHSNTYPLTATTRRCQDCGAEVLI